MSPVEVYTNRCEENSATNESKYYISAKIS